jgi:hypothetical protein
VRRRQQIWTKPLIKKILFVIGALAFVIAIISLVHSVGTLNAVTLTPSNDITIEFGQVGSVGMGKSIIKTSSVQTVHVSAGTYAVVFTRPGYSSVFTQNYCYQRHEDNPTGSKSKSGFTSYNSFKEHRHYS